MLTAQEAKERSERAIHIKKDMEFNKGIALIEERIKDAISQGKYKCVVSVKTTDDLYTKDEKILFHEKIKQTITSYGYKIVSEGGSCGSDNTFFHDYVITWR